MQKLNAEHIKKAEIHYLYEQYICLYDSEYKNKERLLATIDYVKNRISVLKEIEDFKFLYLENYYIDLSQRTFEKERLQRVILILKDVRNWDKDTLKLTIKSLKEAYENNMKLMYYEVRLLLSGYEEGIDVLECFMILGQELVLARLEKGLA